MKRSKKAWLWGCGILAVLVVVALIAAALVGLLAPVRMTFRFPLTFTVKEAQTMNDCRDCHEADTFHDCQTCHDAHGSADMSMVPFDDLFLFQGDVPDARFIPINDILPYQEYTRTHISLVDLLAHEKVTGFESVTLLSRDEGFVTIEQPNLTSSGLLMPHADGMRFADENLHVSSWLKGVWRIVVVGRQKPLRIDGVDTSIGRLLLGPTRSVTLQEAEAMYKSPDDEQVRKSRSAHRAEGAAIADIVAHPDFQTLVVRDGAGHVKTLSAAEAEGALLLQLRNSVTLVLPARNESQWIADVVEITSQP